MARPKDPQRTTSLRAAAASVVQERGIAGLTLRPLAAELGVAPRTLLYHFGSKENLLIEAIRHLRLQQPDLARTLSTDLQHGDDAADLLAEAITRMWDEAKRAETRPFLALYFELAALSIRDPDQYGTMLREADQEWTDAIAALLSRSGIGERAVQTLTDTLLIGYRGALHFALTTDRWDASDKAITALNDGVRLNLAAASGGSDPRPSQA